MEKVYEQLKSLTAVAAPSGFEDPLIGRVKRCLEQYADEVTVDRVGNVTALFKGMDPGGPELLVFAHLDEVGLMVSKVEESGFLRFERIGGVPEKTLPGQFVDVFSVYGDSSYPGVIGAYAHHLTPDEAKRTVPSREQMYIDIGMSSREEVLAAGINAGSPVTYRANLTRLGKYRVAGKALDNRIGIYLLLQAAEYLHDHRPAVTAYLVASVQEEFNIRGLLPVFQKLQPAAAICLDITPACDTPDLKMKYDIALGKGPAVTQMNFHGRGTLGGLIPNPSLRRFLERIAEEMQLPYQREVIIGVITDDAFTQLAGDEGAAMAHLSVPLRYTHAPIETADLRDIQWCASLINKAISRFDGSLDLRRGC
jgi:putative aminopeptidase FrvX